MNIHHAHFASPSIVITTHGIRSPYSCLLHQYGHLRSGHAISLHVGTKAGRVPGLKEDRARTCELADQSFTGSHARDNAARGNAFHHVFRVPCHEMSIIDNVAFAILELWRSQYAEAFTFVDTSI